MINISTWVCLFCPLKQFTDYSLLIKTLNKAFNRICITEIWFMSMASLCMFSFRVGQCSLQLQ